MSTNDDWVLPSWNGPRNTLKNNGLAKNGATDYAQTWVYPYDPFAEGNSISGQSAGFNAVTSGDVDGDGHREIFGTLVENISGRRFSEIRQDINAVGVSDALAGPLKTTPGAHALAIRRQYLFSSNEMAEVSLSIHPADRYSYTTRLTRQEAETV